MTRRALGLPREPIGGSDTAVTGWPERVRTYRDYGDYWWQRRCQRCTRAMHGNGEYGPDRATEEGRRRLEAFNRQEPCVEATCAGLLRYVGEDCENCLVRGIKDEGFREEMRRRREEREARRRVLELRSGDEWLDGLELLGFEIEGGGW